MESALADRYNDVDVYLISEGGQYFVSFGNPNNHHYWLVALNKIMDEKPDYKFSVRLSEDSTLDIVMVEFESVLSRLNELVDVVAF